MKQLHDPLLSKDDCQLLTDTIQYCAKHINEYIKQNNTGSSQTPDTDPNDPANSLTATPRAGTNNQNSSQVNQNLSMNPNYHPTAPSPGPVQVQTPAPNMQNMPFRAPFQSPAPYQLAQPIQPPTNPIRMTPIEVVLDESNLYPDAVDERVSKICLMSCQARANLDDKQ